MTEPDKNLISFSSTS